MVQVSPPKSDGGNLGNVIVGAFGLTGALVIGALVAGTLLAGIWIVWRKWRRTYDSDAPPTFGPVALTPEDGGRLTTADDGATRPPSSPTR